MKKLLIISAVLFTLCACEDVLDLTPQDKISEDKVWNDPNLVRLYINSCYNTAFEQGLYRTTQIGHATDELHSIKGSVYYKIITQGALTADNISQIHSYLNCWSKFYGLNHDINVFFDKINDADFDEDIKNEMIGEMKFIRAFIYAHLIWRYGGVPIIDYLFDLNQEDYSVSRNTYDECVDFIVNELNDAIELLPNQQTGKNLGKISADAARALKARVLLYAASPLNNPANDLSKWQAASDAAEELINTRYQLHNDYHDLFLAHNNEIIFARYHTQANQLQLSLQVGRNYDHGWGSDSQTQNLVNDYEMTNGQPPYLPDGNINPASGYDPQNPYVNRDPRFYATILYDGSVWMGRATETFNGGKDTRTGPNESWNGTMSGYYTKKFVPEDIPPTGSTVYPTSPWIIFRYAEILLNYAEAQYMLGHEDQARQYINMVRSREGVNMPAVDDAGEDLLRRIRNERRIELVFEGHRYFDVRRWKIAPQTESKNIMGINITKQDNGTKTYDYTTNLLITRQWDDNLYLLPIPQTEIDRSLDKLLQNPGY